MHCCDSMCVAGCSGGTTESHCVVSEKGGVEIVLFSVFTVCCDCNPL